MKRIVVGMDGSETAADALRWAAALAAATGAEVHAVNAFAPLQSEMRPGYLERLRSRQAEELAQWCGDVLDGVESTTRVIDGDPRDALPAAIEDHESDLLVVASVGQGSRGPGFLHLGSVVEYLAHHLAEPLAVVPPGAPTSVSRIVVGLDGSAHGRAAVRWVADVAAATGASVVAVTVAEPGQPIEPTDSDTWRHDAEEVVAEWATPLAPLGDRLTVVVSQDLPVAQTILAIADREGADLVVVGARGVGGVIGLRIGGTALAALHRTERPLVLIPPDPADGD